MPLIDTITDILGAITTTAGAVIPILERTGVLTPPPPVFAGGLGLTPAQLASLGFPVDPAGVGAAAGALGSFLRRQLPGIAAGVAGGEIVEGLAAAGAMAPAACITPVTRTTTRLPRTVDVPVADSSGNVHVRTYVKAPRVRYGVPVITSRRRSRGCR